MTDKIKSRRRRAPAMAPDKRIETILEAALAVFIEKGFAAARFRRTLD